VKVLVDENLDHGLRKLLAEHEVFTVSFLGWAGLKNGELLRAAEDNGMEVLPTGHQSLGYEQNLTGRKLAIVVVSAIRLPILVNYLPDTYAAITGAKPGSFQTVGCGVIRRKP
jgi:hypothetical protein